MRKTILMIIILTLVGIQFIEVDTVNPAIQGEINAPADVKEILKTSCYDCHSNETKWPWYSKVAPVSWLIASHVEDGRGNLNFSNWEVLDSRRQKELQKEMIEEIEKGDMPLSIYTILHPGAKLDVTKTQILKKWALGSGSWGMYRYR